MYFFTVLTSCTSAPEKTEKRAAVPIFIIDSAKPFVEATNKMYGETFASGNSAKFVSCYTSDACIYVTNVPNMCRQQAITDFFNGAYAMGIRNLKLTTERITGSWEAFVETGSYELFVDKRMSIDKGKYIVIWKEENGQWKMHGIFGIQIFQYPAKK